ncbi:hypothetical protein J2S13_001348 [Oikeobacillus pervagus]|uniref:GmrSD restriction endonucleases N-terminal domain-containing protein n=1 Tax=Oikeobacillus pervagus TaxID=1325931 RepID=A0AAJ1SYN0_9BACI|nr:DUF262 domain-containing protein [Oikeobacillus pervagus]MDQ0214949.1 hypothetical protein [Oikeobacillus pervagus]
MTKTNFLEAMKNINANRPLISVQDIVTFIDKGNKYLKMFPDEMTEEKEMEVLQGIVLSPDYQRTYRATIKEESSIIESLLINIPIPEIFLVISGKNDIQIRHVMDGQHRLNAIYRYINNKFALKGLEILGSDPVYVNKKFSELDKKDKIKILGSHLSVLEFESFEDPEIEIELFKRYNRNTKPLEMQEIEMATYFSETSKYLSGFINNLIENNTLIEKILSEDTYSEEDRNLATKKDNLYKIYNITKARNDKQKNHQELCVILSILENGLQEGIRDGMTASKNFLKTKSITYKNNGDENINFLQNEFNSFNNFLLQLSQKVELPFSTHMLGEEKGKQSKFLMGLAIIVTSVYYYFQVDLESEELLNEIKEIISLSPIADLSYKASSTNMKNVMLYLFRNNKIHEKPFNALTFKTSKLEEIQAFIERNETNIEQLL